MRNILYGNRSFRKLLSFVWLVAVTNGAVQTATAQQQQQQQQARRAGAAQTRATDKAQTAGNPLAGWTGVITYKKTLVDSSSSDEPVFGRIDVRRNRVKQQKSREYRYEGRLVVDGNNPAQVSTHAIVSFSDEDSTKGHQVQVDSCHAFNDEHEFIDDSSDVMMTKASATSAADGFNIRANYDESRSYTISFKFPDANGTYSREQHTTHKGYCQPKNNEPIDLSQSEATKVEGETVRIEDQFTPEVPYSISGSKSWGGLRTGSAATFYYEVSWKLTRKPTKLLITDLRFEEMKFPNWNEWHEIASPAPTVDGNIIKIKAKVLNLSDETKFAEVAFKETYKGDKWDGAKPDEPLKDGTASVRLDAGEEREVEVLWDSEGYAWYDDGRPRQTQRFKAEVAEDGKVKDSKTENLNIVPKPLILVHGIRSAPKDFDFWQNLLNDAHSGGWRAYIFGATSAQAGQKDAGFRFTGADGKMRSVFDNSDELAKYVNYAQKDLNAWHVDMVAHSTGGLVARLFVHKQMQILPDNRPTVKHLMLLGVPNNGIPCQNIIYDANDILDNPLTAKELLEENIRIFNQYVKDRKGTLFSALGSDMLPSPCPGDARNDGFVSVMTAIYGIEDYAITKDFHKNLTAAKHFGEFVKPHVVTGPHGTYPLPVKSE